MSDPGLTRQATHPTASPCGTVLYGIGGSDPPVTAPFLKAWSTTFTLMQLGFEAKCPDTVASADKSVVLKSESLATVVKTLGWKLNPHRAVLRYCMARYTASDSVYKRRLDGPT